MWGRVGVGNYHLRQRGTIEYRADATLILVTDGVEHKPFTWCESNAEVPFLPDNFVILHRKAWSFGLGNFHRFQVSAHLSNCLRCIVSRFRWQGNNAIILDPDNLHLIQINNGP